jgi:predicted hydrolase (HD superfamily)
MKIEDDEFAELDEEISKEVSHHAELLTEVAYAMCGVDEIATLTLAAALVHSILESDLDVKEWVEFIEKNHAAHLEEAKKPPHSTDN